MASGNKGGQGQNRQNGGANEQSPGAGQQIREGAESAVNRVQEGWDQTRDGVARGYRRVEGSIARKPGPSLAIGFGLGFGFGMALVALLGQSEHETWTERNITGPMKRGVDSVHDTVKATPDQIHHLVESIASRLPDAIKKRLG